MKRAIALATVALALCATTGCTKNKVRAEKLTAELARCQEAVQQLESGQITAEEREYYAALKCGTCEGGAQ